MLQRLLLVNILSNSFKNISCHNSELCPFRNPPQYYVNGGQQMANKTTSQCNDGENQDGDDGVADSEDDVEDDVEEDVEEDRKEELGVAT